MNQVEHSRYLAEKKPTAQKLLRKLLDKYEYASVLLSENEEKYYRTGKTGITISKGNNFGGTGIVIKVYDGASYAEYSANDITDESVDKIVCEIEKRLIPMADRLPGGFSKSSYGRLDDEPLVLCKSTSYEIHPRDMGDEKIIGELNRLREKAIASDDRLIDAVAAYNYQEYHKLFLSRNKDMEQSVLYSCAMMFTVALKGEQAKDYYKGHSNLGGAEVLRRLEADIPVLVQSTVELLDSEPMIPGMYDCICTPDVTGMIVHEAFGHGVEMDMFVKDRALAQAYIGEYVASPLITMHDGCAVDEVATYFFDDEGTPSHDTVIIDRGVLVRGMSDAQSAMHLSTVPTGNGRRESYERKAYTRMTNTYFEPGQDKVEDMIASVEYGMLLDNPSSGMEDPKNWGIQCMVTVAREIKNGKLTGRVFSPIVLTGYVPDLLKSITMVSGDLELGGGGACGKGHKEWVKVSDGGPWIKARIRLG